MRRSIVIFIIFAVIAILALLYLRRVAKPPIPEAQGESESGMTNSNTLSQTLNLPPKSSSNDSQSQEVPPQFSQASSIEKTPQEIIAEENLKSQDFYGKVVDQHGQPIPDVDVSGVLIIKTDEGFNSEPYTNKTDLDGMFEFIGLHGADFNINIKKNGYYMSERGGGYQAPVGGKSSQDNRVLLTMWKIQGAATLLGSSINAKIPYDGRPVTFDRITGKESSDGDLRVVLSRFPLQLKPGLVHPYSWQFRMEIIGGGLIKESDPYPYFAPDNGYLSSFEFQVNSNAIPWESQIEQNFYIKTSQGQYGRMQMTLYSAQKTPTIQISLTINPSGSQNLEPDFSK